MPSPRSLVHTEWFDHALQNLGTLPKIDTILAEEFYRIAVYADLVATVNSDSALRIYQSKEFLRDDGQLIRLLIYFVLRTDNSVELQHIEAIEQDMKGAS